MLTEFSSCPHGPLHGSWQPGAILFCNPCIIKQSPNLCKHWSHFLCSHYTAVSQWCALVWVRIEWMWKVRVGWLETLLLEGVHGGWWAGEELRIEENVTLNSGSRKVRDITGSNPVLLSVFPTLEGIPQMPYQWVSSLQQSLPFPPPSKVQGHIKHCHPVNP